MNEIQIPGIITEPIILPYVEHTGARGPGGPNIINSQTQSDGTGDIHLLNLQVDGQLDSDLNGNHYFIAKANEIISAGQLVTAISVQDGQLVVGVNNAAVAIGFSADDVNAGEDVRVLINGVVSSEHSFAPNTKLYAGENGTLADSGNQVVGISLGTNSVRISLIPSLAKVDVGLNNVDNTSDANKPISIATAAALSGKSNVGHTHTASDITDFASAASAASPVQSVAGREGDVVLTKADVGLNNVDNTSDSNKPISIATQTELNNKSNVGHTHIASDITDFSSAVAPLVPVKTVAGRTGDVVLTKADVGLNNVDNTSDLNKPISNATQTALNSKSEVGHTHVASDITDFSSAVAPLIPVKTVAGRTGDVTLTKADVGLSNVDNTSDANKPISDATQTALDNKSNIGHAHTASNITDFNSAAGAAAPVQSVSGKTGDVTLTKADVGLSNVDNTSDANKPISDATQTALDNKSNVGHTHVISDTVGLQDALNSKQPAGSYATLVNGLVPSSQLPSFVDDVIEVTNFSSLPTLGESGKIYTTLDNNKIYRWSGSAYVEISASPGSTDAVPEGNTNLYYTDARAAAAAPVQSVNTRTGAITLSKSDVGLSNVDNTSDANKPISIATQTALNSKSDVGHTHSASDITNFNSAASAAAPVQSVSGRTGNIVLSKTDVGLSNVDNTSDANKPIGIATQTALDGKANASHTHGNITNDGRIGSIENLVVTTTTNGALTISSRSGIDSRSSFPNDDVTAATSSPTPLTLARRDANGGAEFNELGVDRINFDITTALLPTVGGIVWNDTDGTLEFVLKGNVVKMPIGTKSVERVVNKTNAALTRAAYQVIRIRNASEGGAQGQRLAGVLAQADNDPNSVDTLGIVSEDIANNEEGWITTSGVVTGINTTGSLQGETWNSGDMLFLSPSIPGQLTKIKPQAPNHTVVVGFVIHAHATQGKIYVKVDNGYEIDELHNVQINDVSGGDVLAYDGVNDVWKNTKDLAVDSLTIGGNQAATAVDPVRTTLTGDGILSSFSINGAANLINPSALIVAIDGVLQEPVVDYGVNNGIITFTDPLASGAKAVIISPSNALIAGQVVPSDGSVTSAKIAAGVTLESPTLTGPVNLTSQDASTADRVMTRALVESIMLESYNTFQVNLAGVNPIASNGGQSSISSKRGAYEFFTNTTASSLAGATASSNWVSGGVNYNRRFEIIYGASWLFNSPLTNNTLFFQFGRSIGAAVAQITNKGFGFTISSNGNIQVYCHDGSTLTNGSIGTRPATSRHFALEFIPSVGVFLYGIDLNGDRTTISSVTTNLPTGALSSEGEMMDIFLRNDGTPASGLNIYYISKWVLKIKS